MLFFSDKKQQIPQKLIKRTTLQPSNSTPLNIPKRTVFMAACSKQWNQPKCPLTEERINKSCGLSIQENII